MYEEFMGMSTKWKLTIIAIVLLLISTIISSGIIGCKTPSAYYIEANYKNARIVLPDMISYIKNDDSLDDMHKEIRIKAVKKWWKIINQTYEEYQNKKKGIIK